MAWAVEHLAGPAAAAHAREVPDPPRRAAWVVTVDRPALVLGSAQRDEVVDRRAAESAGVDVVRRRSGGGAVLLEPGACTWVDLVLPRGDPLWDDDVARAAGWVGEAWAGALGALGVDAVAHRGPMLHRGWSRLVCFAGVAPGEVVAAGRKVVGVSQRRTRHAARFQCLVLRRWDPLALLALLTAPPDRLAAAGELADVAAGVDREPADVAAALLDHLP